VLGDVQGTEGSRRQHCGNDAAMHSGLVDEDYYRHWPVLGKVKLTDFAQKFAAVHHQQ
jgi:hypothetical protein